MTSSLALAVLELALSRATSHLRAALRRPWPRGARPSPAQYARWWHAQDDADRAYRDAMELTRALAPLLAPSAYPDADWGDIPPADRPAAYDLWRDLALDALALSRP